MNEVDKAPPSVSSTGERGPMTAERLKVRVFPYREKLSHGNIMWEPSHQMRAGKFPRSHPVGGEFMSSRGNSQCGDSDAINAFRDRGYWASCFPEGDGITWKPMNGQTDTQCLTDIRECFPEWDARWDRNAKVQS